MTSPRDISDYRSVGIPRDRSFVLDSREVQLRRQRSASREKAQTLRSGTRLSRPVSVPFGGSDQVPELNTSRNRHSLEPTITTTTPRRSHSDCYTRSSPKPMRKFKPPSRKV